METAVYKNKLKLVFDKFLKNKHGLSNYYFEKLINCFETIDKEHSQILLDFLLYALSKKEKVSQSVNIFIMNMLTIIMKNEILCNKLVHMKGLNAFAQGLNIAKQEESSPSIRIAFIKQATIQIEHDAGLQLILEHNIWLQIFKSCYEKQLNHVSKASYNFLQALIWRLNQHNDDSKLMSVMDVICKPLTESEYNNIQNLDSDVEDTLIAQLMPTLLTLMAVLKTSEISKIDKVAHLLARYFILECRLFCFLEVTRDNDFAAITSDLLFAYAFSYAAILDVKNSIPPIPGNEISLEGVSYCNLLHLLIQKRMISVIIEFSVKSLLYWEKFGQNYNQPTFQRYGRTFHFRTQLVMIIITPLLCFTENINPFFQESQPANGLTSYVLKLGHITVEHVVKVCYTLKTLLEDVDKRSVAISVARNISRLKGHLNDDQATIIFQAVFYVLREYIPTDGLGSLVLTENKVRTADDCKLLSLSMDVLIMLLKEHNINWYDSYEVICLYNITTNLLKPKSLPSKLVIQALDLINLTVSKFLSPDLTLLMESKTGSVLNEIGETIKLNMADPEWEVRDSAMNLLLTCTEISFVKYIPFQKLIATNELLVDAAQAAVRDKQMYVQAASLKCMAAASRLDCIWKQVLDAHPHFYIELIYICQHHPEGMVRKEAIVALTEISMKQKFQNDFKKLVYRIMFNAALNDLHWEVQLASLTFWKKTIQSHFSNRGMIDGKFPSVTFSREKRKIITLNQEEIRKQLAGILNELSLIGCLYVLRNCISEYNNIKVLEYAYSIVNDFIDLLTRYNFVKVTDTAAYFPIPTSVVIDKQECNPMDLSFSHDPQVANSRDKVVDSIVNTVQSELINKLYEDFVEVKVESKEEEVLRNIPEVQMMHPNQFIDDFRNNNYKNIIESKKKWNSGTMDLNSLLDEIISIEFEINDYNSEQ